MLDMLVDAVQNYIFTTSDEPPKPLDQYFASLALIKLIVKSS